MREGKDKLQIPTIFLRFIYAELEGGQTSCLSAQDVVKQRVLLFWATLCVQRKAKAMSPKSH